MHACRYKGIWVPEETRRGHWISCAGVTGSWGLPDTGSGNWSQICCKNSKWSQPLSLYPALCECFKRASCHIAQAALEFLSSSDSLCLVSRVLGFQAWTTIPSNLYLMETEILKIVVGLVDWPWSIFDFAFSWMFYYILGPVVAIEKVTVSIIDFLETTCHFHLVAFVSLFVFGVSNFHCIITRLLIICPASMILCASWNYSNFGKAN